MYELYVSNYYIKNFMMQKLIAYSIKKKKKTSHFFNAQNNVTIK